VTMIDPDSKISKILDDLYKQEEEPGTAFEFKPIGNFESVYREKFGTPRQSGFVQHARARLTLSKSIDPKSLDGLDKFTYVWLIFVFHLGMDNYNNKKSKIAPPKLEGEKKGVFATRSPHRYNPIGLSLAKLDKI
jgi:tRNA (adenine37-N6)-methyltransferase